MKKLCLLIALAMSTSASAAFRCVDEKGRTHIGDTPPAGCANVVMYEVTRGGTVLRKIEPTMTEEQFKAKLDAEERQRLIEKAAAEQKRKDMALLSTYSTEKEFDVARERNVDPLKGRIEQSHVRIKEIDKRVKDINEEMEFFKAGKKKGAGGEKEHITKNFLYEVERLGDEKKKLHKEIAGNEKEIGEIRAKYDADKRRWLALKSGTAGKTAEVAAADPKLEPKPEAKPAAKADAKPAPKK